MYEGPIKTVNKNIKTKCPQCLRQYRRKALRASGRAAMPFHLFLLLPLFLNSALTVNVSNECKALNGLVLSFSSVLSEDQDSYLCNVTLFRKAVDDFRHKARENKFIVRDFQYNEEEMKADKEEMNRLSTDKKKQFGPLVRWLKVNFSEAFIAWIHVKALRVFVESVLRYGLPVNFQAMLLQPNKKTMKKLREVLYELYKHLDSSAAAIIDAPVDIPGLNLSQQEYYPYVYYKIDCNLLEFK